MARTGKVGCAGILVADTFCGPLPEMPPEGSLVAVDDLPDKAGGCAGNVSIDLARQGVPVELLGCLGNDAGAEVLRRCLELEGVSCDALITTDEATTSKTVILLIEGQDRRFIHTFGANATFRVEHISRSWLDGLSIFYLGGLFALPGIDARALAEVLAYCREKRIVTVLDVVVSGDFDRADDLRAVLPMTDYFLPNDDEARIITGAADPDSQVAALADWGAETVIVTLGRDGCIAGRDGRTWRAGVYEMDVVDPTGCGDAFASGVIAAIASGAEMSEMIQYASAIGASATRAVGTTDGVWGREETEAFVKEHPLDVRHET